MSLPRNTPGFLRVLVLDASDDPLTGDAANVTAKVSKDGGAFVALAGSASELGDGFYTVPLTASETNAERLDFSAASSTTDAVAIVTGGQDGPTTSPERATLTPGPLATTKRVAALARVSRASIGQDVDFALTGQTTKTVTVVDNYDNDDTSTSTAVNTFFDVSVDTDISTLTLTVTPSGGSSATVEASELLDADAEFGCVPLAYDSVHAGPTSVIWRGELAAMVSEAGSARRHLSVGGQPWGELFADVPASDRQPDDRYHQGSALAVMGDTLVAAMSDHNSQLYVTWGKDQRQLRTRKSLQLSDPADEITYPNICATDDAVYISARNQTAFHVYEIKDFDQAAPTVRTMVWYESNTSTKRPYPRGLHALRQDDGSDLIVGALQLRLNGTTWAGICAFAFDPATNLVYNSRGETNGNTADGTSASPKLAASLVEGTTFTDTNALVLVGSNGGNTRYHNWPAIKVRDWNATNKRLWTLCVFADTDNSVDASASNLEFRLLSYNGTTRVVSTAGADPFGLDGGPSFRFTSFVRWIDDDLSSTDAEVFVGVRADDFLDVDDEYNGFGANSVIKRAAVNASGLSVAADLDAAVTLREDIPLGVTSAAEIRGVKGSDGVVICEQYARPAEVRGAARWRRLGTPKRVTTDAEAALAVGQSSAQAIDALPAPLTASEAQTASEAALQAFQTTDQLTLADSLGVINTAAAASATSISQLRTGSNLTLADVGSGGGSLTTEQADQLSEAHSAITDGQSGTVAIKAAVDAAGGTVGDGDDIKSAREQEPIADSRTARIVFDENRGYVSEEPLRVNTGASALPHAADFSEDLQGRDRIGAKPTIEVEVLTGSEGGLDVTPVGFNHQLAVFDMAATAVGTYRLRITASYVLGGNRPAVVDVTVH